jgi:hypothetical protein
MNLADLQPEVVAALRTRPAGFPEAKVPFRRWQERVPKYLYLRAYPT